MTLPFHPLLGHSINAPKVQVDLSLSPPTHSFTRPNAPIITQKLTLLPGSPFNTITLYTENTPLDPRRALTRAGYTITNLTTHEPVKLTTILNVQRGAYPRLRAWGSAEEKYFITLHTNDSIPLSAEFGRRNFKPQPWSIVKLGRELDADGNPRNIRRSASVTGVDGLEPGREYEIGLNEVDLEKVWWVPLAKEDVLLERGSRGLDAYLERYEWVKDRPVEFRVMGTRLKVLEEGDDEEDGGIQAV
ncbi:hypothetical protein M426DRAFT_63487 [Hypoxylon sp. CI-4A]|nr:hypothetical protein M426DRAFT_63487 [Hypoxylon sp. CI-4A]